MTMKEFAEFVAVMNEMFGGQPKSDVFIRAWHGAFAKYTVAEAMDALYVVKPQGQAPQAHEILTILADQGIDAEGLVADVLVAIRTRGYVRIPPVESWRSPAVAETIEAFGGWVAVCTEIDIGNPAVRAQFRDTIRARMNERRSRGLPVVNREIAPIAEQNALAAPPLDAFPDPSPEYAFDEESDEWVPMPDDAKRAIEAMGDLKKMPR